MKDFDFDWVSIIAAEFPSDSEHSSPTQRARHTLYREVKPATDSWCRRYELDKFWPTSHLSYETFLDVSAFQSSCRTLDPTNRPHAHLFAKYLMWLSVVDLLLDDYLLPRLLEEGDSRERQMAHVDTLLWRLAGSMRQEALSESEIGELLGATNPPRSIDIAPDETGVQRIEAALPLLLDEIPGYAPAGARRFLATEIAVALGYQRNELVMALDFAEDGSKPDLDPYLNSSWNYMRALLAPSYVTIPGIAETGSFADWLPATDACGRVARLANDHGSFIREQEEGRFNSAIIALDQLGYPTYEVYSRESLEFRQAMNLHREWLDIETAKFLEAADRIRSLSLPHVQQNHLMLVIIGFYLAAYEHGDFDLGMDSLAAQTGDQ